MPGVDEIRIDRWLWAVRVYKTRSLATQACRGGHVKINGAPAKPASLVRSGDRVSAFAGRERVLEVVRVIETRVSAPIASECIVDHSPPAPSREMRPSGLVWGPGAGRPTKKARRQIDRLRSRSLPPPN
jgi:ribosome-associated heat shock protein Hsp15